MLIFDKDGNLLIDIEVDDTSVRYKVIKGENSLTLKFSLAEHMELPLGAFCEFKNERYTLMQPEDFTMHHRRSFEYSVIMYSEDAKAKRYMFVNPVDGRLKFSLTAKPKEHLQMFVDNLNSRDSGWSVGECPDQVEIVLSYNHTTCHDALVQLANELELDYWFDSKKVNLGKLELYKDNPLQLSYGGDGKGLKPNIKRTNYTEALPVEILYVQGTEVNIDPSKYGSVEMHLPKSQTLGYDGHHFDNEEGFKPSDARYYKTDDKGYYISRADKEVNNFSEDSLDCTEIEPTKEEKVSAVVVVDAEKHFYDILFDSNVDYGKYVIEGEKATITFQSGMLAGKEFDLATDKNGNLICKKDENDHWRVEIVPQQIDGITMPDEESHYIPKGGEDGDKFKVFGIQLPDEFIADNATKTGAEWEMFRYAVKHFYNNEDVQYTISGELDEIYAKKNWENIEGRLKLGSYVSFTDKSFQEESLLIRITGIKEYVNKPHSPLLEISNAAIAGSLVGSINRVENQEAYTEQKIKDARRFTKRTFADAQRAIKLLEDAFGEGFEQSIKPATVQTMMMLVGDESLQYEFVDSRGNKTTHNAYFDADTKVFHCDAGRIKHFTIGVKEIRSKLDQSHKQWSVNAFDSAVLDSTEKDYYVYAVVSQNGTGGNFELKEDPVGLTDVTGKYYLLLGLLLAENSDNRDFLPLYGFTQILPGQITTDVIRSADGKTYFDLANSEIGGRITFASGSSGLTNLSEWSGAQSQIDKALQDAEEAFNAQKAFAEQTTKDLEGLQDQIDGNITSWFYDGVPTLSNAPAKDWSTTDLKNNHLGDLYYDQNSGKAYRFQMNGTTYEWKLIADEDITKALELAGDAQDTADAKRRVFFGTSTPTGEKDKGDLWTNGTDLYVWNGTSWEKATKYTDDTTANAAIEIAETAQNVANTASANATNAASLANDAKALAETAKGAAEEAEELIETANNYAKEAKEAAESSENAAKLSQQAAETAQQAVEDGQITVDESKRIAEDAKAASDAAQEASKEAEEAAIAAQQAAQAAQNLADEAKADAEKAAQDAEQAASDAKNASDRLDEWADDELVSPSDIPAIENELIYIAADKTDIDAQLEIYDILNEDTISDNFNTAYNAYEDALNAVLKLEIGTTFPEDLDDKQTAYYTQRTVILEAIAKAAKKVADDAQKTATDAQGEAEEAAKTADEAKQNAEDALLAAQNAEAASQAAQQAAAAAQAKANEVSEKIDGDNYFTEIEKKTIRSIIAEITECREKLHENNAIVKFTTKQGHSWYLVKEDSYAEWTDANEEDHSVSQSKYAGYYSSNLHNANSYSVTQVDVELTEGREVDIQLDYFSDAESTNDWMTVGARGTTVSPANTTTTSNTLPNRAGSTYGKQRMVFSKVYNITQEVDAEKRYFQVAYKKNATIDVGTDSAYFRISNPHYIDESGSLHIIELKGSFHRYYLLLKQKGYTEVADMLYDALTEILGLLNANGLWTSGTTELTDGVTFRATLNEYLTDYYAILASCGFDIMDSKLADFDYLAGALKDGSKTLTDGGLIMTSLVAVGDTSTTNADVEAFMNGSDFCKDNEHGKLIHAMGIPRSVTEDDTEYTDLEKRSKAAQTRIYEDGTIISKNAELNEGCVIGGTVKVTANGIEVDASDAWGKVTISDEFGLRRQDGKLDVQIGGSCAGSGLNISNGTPAHGVCYGRNSTEYVCATFATTPGKRAIDIFDGMIGGMRPNTVSKSNGGTLTYLDHTCFAASGSIYLPSDPQIGQNYRIIHTSSSGLRVAIPTTDYNSTFKNIGSLTTTNLYIQSSKIEMIELIYDGSNWWYMTSRND